MNERNPDRDWPVICARQAVKKAEEELARKPSPFNALELQAQQYSWKKLIKLELVKKTDNGKLR